VPGDYDGDGTFDQAVFDTVGGYWYIKSLNGNVITWKNQWGWSTAAPVPGDYDGDGKYDLAVFDTVGGYWYIKSLTGNVITWENQWGWSTARQVSLMEMTAPTAAQLVSANSLKGYQQNIQNTLDAQGFTAAVNYAKTAGAVGKVFVLDDGTSHTVRDIDIYDNLGNSWVLGNGTTTSRSWTTLYFYAEGSLRMQVYLGW